MKVEVTADDIANGRPGDDCNCPIAIACKRTFGKDASVRLKGRRGGAEVVLGELVDGVFDVHEVLTLPFDAMFFIKAFDRGRSVLPTEFEV